MKRAAELFVIDERKLGLRFRREGMDEPQRVRAGLHLDRCEPLADRGLEREPGMRFTFVDDLATAVDQAGAAATHGAVVIMGRGDVIGQALEQGLVDELRIHLAPMLLGGGTPLFKPGTRQMYRQRDIRPSKNAVHLTYERV